jgi:hypothetical protein
MAIRIRIRFGNQVPPSEAGYRAVSLDVQQQQKEEQAKLPEPPRSSLTEPPAGYQTPSPAQPYGLAKGTAPSKPYNDYTDRADMSKTHR